MFVYKYMAGILDSPLLGAVSSMFLAEGVDDDYEPHDHRNVIEPTTYAQTFVHMIKGSIGAGILAMPLAIAKVGLIMGVTGLCLITIFATYCIQLLIWCQYKLCKKHKVGYLTYPQSMKLGAMEGPRCFRWTAKYFPCFVDGVLILWQLGLCCVYVVFISENIKQVCDAYDFTHPIRLHMCVVLLPLLLISMPKSLKFLAPISTIANVLTMAGLILILSYLVDVKDTNKVVLVGDWMNIPVFTGITLFALEAVGVILALEYHMERPRRFVGCGGLFSIGMSIILTLYVAVGICGYLKFGNAVSDSITLSLPNKEIRAQVTKVMLAVAVLMSFPLQNFVAYEIIWNHCVAGIKPGAKRCCDYCMRVFLVVITFLVAVAVPKLGPFISLFGALCLSMLGIVFPGVLDICVRYPNYGRCKIYVFHGGIIVILGLFALIAGTYTSILDIVHD